MSKILLVSKFDLFPRQKQADPASLGNGGEGAPDLGGEGEGGVHDGEEGGGDDPEELVEHAEVGLAVPDQAALRVEDQEGAEAEAGEHEDKEELSGEVLGLEEDATDGDAMVRGVREEEQEAEGETADWSKEACSRQMVGREDSVKLSWFVNQETEKKLKLFDLVLYQQGYWEHE